MNLPAMLDAGTFKDLPVLLDAGAIQDLPAMLDAGAIQDLPAMLDAGTFQDLPVLAILDAGTKDLPVLLDAGATGYVPGTSHLTSSSNATTHSCYQGPDENIVITTEAGPVDFVATRSVIALPAVSRLRRYPQCYFKRYPQYIPGFSISSYLVYSALVYRNPRLWLLDYNTKGSRILYQRKACR